MTPDATPPIAPQPTTVTCPKCGYNLTGIAIGGNCPECGLVIGRGVMGMSSMPMSGKAIASLVLGIVSIVGCSFYGIISVPTGIIAIVLGRAVKEQVIREEVSPASAGLAKAGVVCGIIGLCLGGMLLAFLAVLLIVGGVVG